MLREYLKQEGVSPEAVQRGTQFTFVDTGFYGSIEQAIESLFPSLQTDQMRPRMLVSARMHIPSMRVFGTVIDPEHFRYPIFEGEPMLDPHPQRGAPVHDYVSAMPRLVKRATHFMRNSNGLVVPVFDGEREVADPQQAVVDPALFLLAAEDTMSFLRSADVLAHFRERLGTWSSLYQLYSMGKIVELKSELRRMGKAEGAMGKATARDFIELTRTDLARLGPELNESDIGLDPVLTSRGNFRTYQAYGFDPDILEQEVKRLVSEKKWAILEAFLLKSLGRRDGLMLRAFRLLSMEFTQPALRDFIIRLYKKEPDIRWVLYDELLVPAHQSYPDVSIDEILIAFLSHIDQTAEDLIRDIADRFIGRDFLKNRKLSRAYLNALKKYENFVNDHRKALFQMLRLGDEQLTSPKDLLDFVLAYRDSKFQIEQVERFLREPTFANRPAFSKIKAAIETWKLEKRDEALIRCGQALEILK